jgi:hypothetical protein
MADHDTLVLGEMHVELERVGPRRNRAIESLDRAFRRVRAITAVRDDGAGEQVEENH